MSDPDAVGESGSAACGDMVRIQLHIADGRVVEARFLAFGCEPRPRRQARPARR